MEELIDAVDEVLRLLRSNKDCTDPVLETPSHGSGQQCKSFLEDIPRELQDRVLSLSRSLDDSKNQQHVFVSRSVGAMVGMAVADGLGHNFEFLPATDHVGGPGRDGPRIEYDEGSSTGSSVILHKPLNVFELKPGQWTDDASMGLCLADSLLVNGCFDGSHCRILFYNWWNNGLNNAFKFDPSRNKKSVGLGGNISNSLTDLQKYKTDCTKIPPRYTPPSAGTDQKSDDAGNGSLMRLCPIPIFLAKNAEHARTVAYESSFATHPGPLAAEACAFLSSVIVACINRPAEDIEEVRRRKNKLSAREFLDEFASEYQQRLSREMESCDFNEKSAKAELYRLLLSKEPDNSTERCWNWKSKSEDPHGGSGKRILGLFKRKGGSAGCGLGIEQTLKSRGHTYNGYIVHNRYFGSFSLDALAMALYCVRSTSSFTEAVVRCINFLGDADTTAAITAQVAGAFYGLEGIPSDWRRDLEKWDGCGGFELRAVCLAIAGWKLS
jgi:ADP-ribosyl-[dinitrogen reductase] hydrolase